VFFSPVPEKEILDFIAHCSIIQLGYSKDEKIGKLFPPPHNVLYLVMGHPLVMGQYFHMMKSNKIYNIQLAMYLKKLIFQ